MEQNVKQKPINQFISKTENSSSKKVASIFNSDLERIKKLNFLKLAMITCYVELPESLF